MDAALHHQFAEVEREHWWFQGRRQVMAEVLRAELSDLRLHLGRVPRILDAGCGTGEMVDMLRELGEVTAFDPSAEAVRYCRQRFGAGVPVAVGRLPEDLPPPGTVDVVTAFDVLEHLDDDLGALRAVHAVLPRGGVLAVTVPAFPFLWGPHDVVNDHRRRYRRGQLRSRLEAAGFTVERLSYFNTWLFPVAAVLRPLRRLGGRAGPARSEMAMPRPGLNRLLRAVFTSEARLVRRVSLPVGVSLLAVARKR